MITVKIDKMKSTMTENAFYKRISQMFCKEPYSYIIHLEWCKDTRLCFSELYTKQKFLITEIAEIPPMEIFKRVEQIIEKREII